MPMGGPPLENASVEIRDGKVLRLCAHGKTTPSRRQTLDLGEVIVLPGLVNAHCHLDYTAMAGKIKPTASFTDWIQTILGWKSQWGYSEFAASWLAGAEMLLQSGTTMVANIESTPQILAQVRPLARLSVISFLELILLKTPPEPADVVRRAVRFLGAVDRGGGGTGLAPHAPYSTTRALLIKCAEASRARNRPLTIHVSESLEEFEMFMQGRGRMFKWLRPQRQMEDCGAGSPIEALHEAGVLGPNLLAVHANYLGPRDAELLAAHQVSVVHCPRSHDFFDHDPFPFEILRKAGVNVCLGTDSLATVRTGKKNELRLNMFDEMRRFAAKHPGTAPADVIGLATGAGAEALGVGRTAGALREGARADLIAIPYDGPLERASEAVVSFAAGQVSASMVAGSWVIPP